MNIAPLLNTSTEHRGTQGDGSPVFLFSLETVLATRMALASTNIDRTRKWVYLLMLNSVRSTTNKELIITCLVRAKVLELIAIEQKYTHNSRFFLTGLFSSIDTILNRNMEEILKNMPFDEEVKQALLGEKNILRNWLELILDYEKSNWNNVATNTLLSKISKKRFVKIYIDSLRWVHQLNI